MSRVLWLRRIGPLWRAVNPDEVLGLLDASTGVYGWTREQCIRRATKRFYGKSPQYEEHILAEEQP